MTNEEIKIPRYYMPWPHQVAAWQRRRSGKYNYYFKLWSRQTGKDTDDIQYCLNRAWYNYGSQTAYVGLDNVWINQNIFKKTIETPGMPPRYHWSDYPEEFIHPKDTQKEVIFTNNDKDSAPSRIKFIGFLNDQQLIGSSYDNFFISEASLYKDHAFSYIQPIWDQKLSMGKELSVNFNGTPRGMRNVFYDLMRVYSGVDDPELFPGDHGNCYIDKVTIHDVVVPDGNGGFRKLYTPEQIEQLKDRHMREFGNLNFYEQEFECKFTTVNAGLVYLGIEKLMSEKRYTYYNIDPSKPVYAAFDIASKNKMTDATAGIIYQYYNGKMFIYDIYEARSKSFVECFSDLSTKDYFQYIRFVALPWDSDRSASSETPIEEARRMWPQINWHSLDKERVDRGIQQVRKMLPNMIINSNKCDYLLTCFNNYEYKRLEKQDDWAARPMHNKYSHMMDALRYAVMAINEIQYLHLNAEGSDPDVPLHYPGFGEEIEQPWWTKPNTRMKVKKRRDNVDHYQQSF